jgi:hypothetical protein
VIGGQDLVAEEKGAVDPGSVAEFCRFHVRAGDSTIQLDVESLQGPRLRPSNRPFFRTLTDFRAQRPTTSARRQTPPFALDPQIPPVSFSGPVALAVLVPGALGLLLFGLGWSSRTLTGLTDGDVVSAFVWLLVSCLCWRPLIKGLKTAKVRREVARQSGR